MDYEKLYDTIIAGCYHDCSLEDALLNNDTLYIYCFRNPPDPDNIEDPNMRFVVLRFDKVTDLKVFDWNSDALIPYHPHSFDKEAEDCAICGINDLYIEDDYIVFDECMRFHCENVALLAHSMERISDYKKYFI